MMRSMYAGVSGLKAHQTKMDVIGNNISNVNTTGYKGSRATFQEMLSQTIEGASSPQDGRGGTNPQQVGLGTQLGSIDTNMGTGNQQSTGKTSDLAIDGEGFFILNDGSKNVYTRAGNLTFDESGHLVNSSSGNRVKGWQATEDGTIAETNEDNLEDLSLDESMSGEATSEMVFTGNLDSETEAGTGEVKHTITADVYDSLGAEHSVTLGMKKSGDNQWEINSGDIDVSDGANISLDSDPHTVNFNEDGEITNGEELELTFDPTGGANTGQTINLDFSDLTQFAGSTTAEKDSVNGYAQGSLQDFTIDGSGTITGSYDNGYNKTLAKIGVAQFQNPEGLSREGGTMFDVSNNSGEANIGQAGAGGRGMLKPGSLEMSNVDLARQFSEMITAQRGFQGNSKAITTSDEMLQTLVNLKR
ncbi:MAG: flagellar basal-body rod protein FlgF [Bacillota bacterium]